MNADNNRGAFLYINGKILQMIGCGRLNCHSVAFMG